MHSNVQYFAMLLLTAQICGILLTFALPEIAGLG
jgi:hypothetical protein